MSAVFLKTYQRQALGALRAYLASARIVGAGPAFDGMEKPGVRTPRKYQPLAGLEAIPYVCLRLPTGGGKTLLSAHAVKIAADEWLERDFPLVLWLTPTNTIRAQTLETLKKPGHANYEALRDAFGGRFRVFDIADFALLTPADLKAYACIFVATTQTLRVSNTEGRKVYAHNEFLEPHFSAVADTTGMDLIEEGEDKGRIKFSFRNLLALNRPLVLVDEAHNNTSKLSVEVLQRVNAGGVVEFTATPAADSNILHNVSATELKAEEMIKLPIRLTEHKSWEDAVASSIRERRRLHALAEKDAAYIRPIVLFQAEDRGQDVTRDILVAHLVEQENIPRQKIAVVTGDQRELDSVDLFARDCPVDYVVTVEALKEGWDCSFAYVFCSVAKVESRTSVEQLLGRVLRMPYAKRRAEPDLNRAYAHVSRASWPNAVNELHDRLVDMGFEQAEAESFIEPQRPLGLQGGAMGGLFADAGPSTVLEVNEDAAIFDHLPAEDRDAVRIEPAETGVRLVLSRLVSEGTRERIVGLIRSPETRARVERETRRHNAQWLARMAPAERGEGFSVPQLAFTFKGERELAEPEAFLDAASWRLTDYSAEISLAEFSGDEHSAQWEVDLRDGHLVQKSVTAADQPNLDHIDIGWTEGLLVQWLEKRLRQQDVTQPVMLEYVRRAVADLAGRRSFSVPVLARWKYILAKVLARKIAACREAAGKANYQELLFGPQAAVETTFDYAFDFSSLGYAPHWSYEGRYLFQKHFYPLVGELKNKGEEFECAKALDRHPKVKHWARNLERRGFWLPLARNRFYPDFVAQLDDGRLLVVEHKGEVYATNDDSREKSSVGGLWQARSGGRGLFLMTVVEAGRPGLYEQIAAAIA